jgi:hypothetical protein
MDALEIKADFGSEPAPSHPIWLEFTELVSTPKQPQPFIIREEVHPLKSEKSIFRVYAENMQPLYIGRETIEEAESELRKNECVSSIEVLY